MRMQGKKREKRYEFEGVVLAFEAYAEASIRRSSEGISQTILGGRVQGKTQAADIFEAVDDAISGSDREARALEAQRLNQTDQTGELYTIFRPEKTEWEAY
jgi:Golgi nucleoside diphosphatase